MRLIVLIAAAITMVLTGTARAGETVRVGGYDFPPFVESQGKTHSGLALDMVALLNKAQDRYDFVFVPTSARRRYADVAEGRIDLMLFESPDWGWTGKDLPVEFSDIFMTGGEVYIARAEPGRDQRYFADLAGKRLVGILGYHYGFAGFEDDPEKLARAFDIKLVNNHASSIAMVLAGRVDVAVVTDAYLKRFLARTPEARDKLLVSNRLDQAYNHRALVRRGGPIDTATMNALLAGLRKSGELDALVGN